jgi:2-polyprenyl-3-methyl-5-hydroxy-6-metoxy-1,4-benzoquinol methylase
MKMGTQVGSVVGQYALATGQCAVHRLEVLEGVYGAGTRALLRSAGARKGMRIADVGCGVGVVSRLLAVLTGFGGAVVGIDASKEQLEQARLQAEAAGLRNTLFVDADASSTGLPRDSFDMVYCRFLLLHLPNPEAALREMVALLKPGGILVCEDGDLTAAGSIPVTALNAFADLFGRLAPVRGVDYAISRRLYHMIAAEGMQSINIHIHQPAIAVGEPKSLLELSVREAGDAFVNAGLVDAFELQSVVAKMRHATEDPNVLALMPPMTQVWAMKPMVH